jgi:hypothetical protein
VRNNNTLHSSSLKNYRGSMASSPDRHMKHARDSRADRPDLADRLALRFSTSRYVDGLWIGTWEDEPEPILRRIEQALALIKRYDRVRYDRLIRDLKRVWVVVLPTGLANFESKIHTCKIDTRYFLAATTTPELIAAVIVHEATHARLWRCGIRYKEAQRPRIEEICLRREIALAAKLPNGEDVRDRAERTLPLCASGDYWTDAAFFARYVEGSVEALRYLGTPDALVRIARALLLGRGRLRRSLARFKRGG